MASRGYEHGSARLGLLFIVSVFGPMAILAALWAFAVGTGESGSARDAFGMMMVWVLLIAGLVVTVEEAALAFVMTFRRPHIDWPAPSAKTPPAEDAG